MPRATPILREKVIDEGVEEPYRFSGTDQLLADFTTDVRRTLGDDTWPRR